MAENKELVLSVIDRISTMQKEQGLALPANYSASNALNYAWILLNEQSKGQSLAQKTTPASQAKALLNMAIQGLSPAKNQCYFIPYGNQLTLQRSYFGSLAVLKRLDNVEDVWAEVVHQDDDFEIGSSHGKITVAEIKPKFENLDKPIIGAYAVIKYKTDDGYGLDYTVMTKKEIDQSWSHARTNKVQKEFPQEMAKRTVLSRAAKYYINTSDDNDLLVGAINEDASNNYDEDNVEVKDVTPSNIDDLIDEPEEAPEPEPKPEPKKKAAAKKAMPKKAPKVVKEAEVKEAEDDDTEISESVDQYLAGIEQQEPPFD